MITASQEGGSSAVGPRAMAEQSILKIIWPPDGRPAWEDRHKIPPIERALNHLLDVVEGAEAPQTSITVAESQALTEKAVALRQQGMKLGQIGDILGLTAKAVSSRLSDARKKQTILRVQTGQRVTFDGKPAALRSAAPNHIVEANEMVTDIDSAEARPPNSAADHIVEADEMVADADSVGSTPAENPTIRGTLAIQEGHVEPTHINMSVGRLAENSPAQPEFEQVARQPSLQETKPEQSENSTIRNDRIVEESKEVLLQDASPENPEKPPGTPQKIEREDGKEWAKIPHTFDAQIIDLKKGGKTYSEIAEALRQQGLNCTEKDVGNRIFRMRKKGELVEVGKERLSTGQRPIEPSKITKPEAAGAPPQSSQPHEKPAPKAMTRAETDKMMWDLWKSGKSPKEVADILWDERLYYSEKSVIIRLRSQGADL